jgi:sulfite exporter TauE/SafE
MIGVGLVTSVHCVAMCGSLVLTYAVKDDTTGPWYRRMMPHAAYQSAKIVSYVVVGVLLGLVGAALDLGGVRGWVTIAAGLFMVLLGINMTGRFPILARLTLRPPRFLKTALSKTRRKAAADAESGTESVATPVTFGLLTGLMPCGPLQAAQLAAAGAGSASAGALTMLGFGLGTAPLMLGFGTVSGMLSARFKQRMLTVAALVIVALGLVMLNRGLLIVGSPVTAQSVQQSVFGAPAATGEIQRGADGVAEIPITISGTQFQPNTFALPEGEPVRLVVDRQEDNACSDELAIPQLGVLADLAPFATTVVDVPAAPGGNYTLTCGMGMMYGLLQVGSGAVGPAVGAPLAVGALVLGLVGLGLWRTRRPAQAVCDADSKDSSRSTEVRVLGFTPQEVIVIVASLAAAIIAGLLFGGLFTY